MPDDTTFDPRYRPEFQRGFDPQATTSEPARTGYEQRPDEDRLRELGIRADRRPLGTDRSSRPGAATEEDPAWVPVAGRPDAAEGDRTNTNADKDADADADAPTLVGFARVQPWRNPWLIALLVLGVLLLLGGLNAFRSSIETMYQPQTDVRTPEQIDWVAIQVWWTIGPLMAVAGALTVVGVVFFAAWWWMPSRRAARDASAQDD